MRLFVLDTMGSRWASMPVERIATPDVHPPEELARMVIESRKLSTVRTGRGTVGHT